MSEHNKRLLGCILLTTAVNLLCFPLLSAGTHENNVCFDAEKRDYRLERLFSLASEDLFNVGSQEDLCTLPGIGGKISSLILNERNLNGLFFFPEDIMSVPGIGIKKYEILHQYMNITTDESEE